MSLQARLQHAFHSPFLQHLGVYFFFALLFSFYFLLDTFTWIDDQFFSIRFAEMIRLSGAQALSGTSWFLVPLPDFWSYNLLFYFSLVPFTLFPSLELGLKVYAVLSLSLFFFLLYYFLKTIRISWPFLATLGIFSLFYVTPFFWRLLNVRAYALSSAWLLLLLTLLIQKRYRWAFLVSLGYFYWHSGTAFFPLLVAGAYFSFCLALGEKKYRTILFPFGGILAAYLLGILFIPGYGGVFAANVGDIIQIVSSTSLGVSAVMEPIEVYPLTLYDLYAESRILVGAYIFFCTLAIFRWYRHFRSPHHIDERKKDSGAIAGTLLLLSLLFLLATLLSMRALDFFVLFSSVFICYEIFLFSRVRIEMPWRQIVWAGGVVCLVAASSNLLLLADKIGSSPNHTSIEGAALWFREHTSPQAVVYTPTMNFFPTFFFYNQGYNRLIIGMEPRLLYEYNNQKYWSWLHLSLDGVVCEKQACPEELVERDRILQQNDIKKREEISKKAGEIIKLDFSSSYVLTSADYPHFNVLLEGSSYFEKIYSTPVTEAYTIYRVR